MFVFQRIPDISFSGIGYGFYRNQDLNVDLSMNLDFNGFRSDKELVLVF
jgi:hypothetical protein